jgi:hypothetical protein
MSSPLTGFDQRLFYNAIEEQNSVKQSDEG